MLRFDAENEKMALEHFEYAMVRRDDHDSKIFELLTGDWKHICFYNKNKGR